MIKTTDSLVRVNKYRQGKNYLRYSRLRDLLSASQGVSVKTPLRKRYLRLFCFQRWFRQLHDAIRQVILRRRRFLEI